MKEKGREGKRREGERKRLLPPPLKLNPGYATAWTEQVQDWFHPVIGLLG